MSLSLTNTSPGISFDTQIGTTIYSIYYQLPIINPYNLSLVWRYPLSSNISFYSANASGIVLKTTSLNPFTINAICGVYTYSQTINATPIKCYVTTFAGSTYNGASSIDGKGILAGFNLPSGITYDGSCNLYVADTYNHTIRKITKDGTVTTISGTAGVPGYGSSSNLQLAIGTTGGYGSRIFTYYNSTNFFHLTSSIYDVGSVTGLTYSSDGNTLFVGNAYAYPPDGSVYIFTYTGSSWIYTSSITAASVNLNGQNAFFGLGNITNSRDGNTLIIGAPQYNNYNGIIKVLTRSNNNWILTSSIQCPVAIENISAYFGIGNAMSPDGNTLFIGAPGTYYVNNYDGIVKIYTYSAGSWNNISSIECPVTLQGTGPGGRGANFGYSIAISPDGNTLFIGATNANTDGVVLIYTYSAGSWNNTSSIPCPVILQGTTAKWGYAIAISPDGSTLYIGSSSYYNSGRANVEVYTYSAGSWNNTSSIVPTPDINIYAYWGTSIAISYVKNTNFNYPYGITYSSYDNALYVADTYNNAICKLSKNNFGLYTSSIVAGQSTSNFSIAVNYNPSRFAGVYWQYPNLYIPGGGINALDAQFGAIYSLATDSQNNIYLGSSSYNAIFKIDHSTGILTTFAGWNGYGYTGDGGLAIYAELGYIQSIYIDSYDNIYIISQYYNYIRKIDHSTGIISTIAGGNGPGYSGDGGLATSAQLNAPYGMAIDSSGDIYIADLYNNAIRKINHSTGIITTFAGGNGAGYTGDGELATSAQLNFPAAIVIDSVGDFYIADAFNNRIRKINHITNIITTIAGSGVYGDVGSQTGDGILATNATLKVPVQLQFDSNNNLYILENTTYRLRKINISTGIITAFTSETQLGVNQTPMGTDIASYNFRWIGAITINSSNEIYISDSGSPDGNGSANVIVKLTPMYIPVTTYSGVSGSADAVIGSNATFHYPIGITSSTDGFLYVADTYNNTIRQIDITTSNYSVVTIAGNALAAPGSTDANIGTNARFNVPSGITINGSNLYVTDSENNTIRQIGINGTATWPVTTFAGTAGQMGSNDGAGSAAQFDYPIGITTDGTDFLYVADAYNDTIRQISLQSRDVTTYAGIPGITGFANGYGSNAKFNTPSGIVYAYGSVFVADTMNSIIRKLDLLYITNPENITMYTYGDYGYYILDLVNPNNIPYQLTFMTTLSGISYINQNGNCIITIPHGTSGQYNVTMQKNILYNPQYNSSIQMNINALADKQYIITKVAGNSSYNYGGDGGLATNASLAHPYGVAIDSVGNIYISDSDNHCIRKVDKTGIITTIAGNGYNGYNGDGGLAINATMTNPHGVAIDSAGNIYFTDYYNCVIRKITISTGIITTVAGNGYYGFNGDGGLAINANLGNPTNVAVDSTGNIYIADSQFNRIRKVTVSTGIITTVAGNSGYYYYGDGGLATDAGLSYPEGVAVDYAGNIYIVDSGNIRIRKVTVSTGIITTVAGNGNYGYYGDGGLATDAYLNFPKNVALDSAGNIYISESYGQRIRKVTVSTGIITTVAGTGNFERYTQDGGLAINTSLGTPQEIALDSIGNIYIANYEANVILKCTFLSFGKIPNNGIYNANNAPQYIIIPVNNINNVGLLYSFTYNNGSEIGGITIDSSSTNQQLVLKIEQGIQKSYNLHFTATAKNGVDGVLSQDISLRYSPYVSVSTLIDAVALNLGLLYIVAVCIDSSNTYLYFSASLGQQGPYSIYKYSLIDTSLTLLCSPTWFPIYMRIHPNGTELYSAGYGSNYVQRISTSTGVITQFTDSFPYIGGNINTFCMDSTGTYLYIMGGAHDLYRLSINNDTSSLILHVSNYYNLNAIDSTNSYIYSVSITYTNNYYMQVNKLELSTGNTIYNYIVPGYTFNSYTTVGVIILLGNYLYIPIYNYSNLTIGNWYKFNILTYAFSQIIPTTGRINPSFNGAFNSDGSILYYSNTFNGPSVDKIVFS